MQRWDVISRPRICGAKLCYDVSCDASNRRISGSRIAGTVVRVSR